MLTARKITKVYKQGDLEVHALRGIDFDMVEGEFTALVGPSGSGKTTLLNMIGALDTPTSGSLVLEGKELAELSRGALAEIRKQRLGFIFQAYNLIPVLTAAENAEFVLLLQGVPAPERSKRVQEMLEAVGLGDMMHRYPRELSGGQQQRVAIARALVAHPAIVLADEPTANLDSKTGAELLDLMKELNQTKGVTFLFSTHDPMVVERATRKVVLKDGLIDEDLLQKTA